MISNQLICKVLAKLRKPESNHNHHSLFVNEVCIIYVSSSSSYKF